MKSDWEMNDLQREFESALGEFQSEHFETFGELGESWQGEWNRSSNEYVRWIQRSLNQVLSLRLAEDGIAGQQTRSAIRSFQQQQGLTPDGVVGPQTEKALIAAGAVPPPGSSGGKLPSIVQTPPVLPPAVIAPPPSFEPVRVDPTDPRIDVSAKFALQRMLKSDFASRKDASEMIAAISTKKLAGIFGDDLRVSAELAKRIGTVRWELIPKGEDAALVLDPVGPPVIIFRGGQGKPPYDGIRRMPNRLDPALRKAWVTFKLIKEGLDKNKINKCLPETVQRRTNARRVLFPSSQLTITNLVPKGALCAIQQQAPCPKPIGQPVQHGQTTFFVCEFLMRFNEGPGLVVGVAPDPKDISPFTFITLEFSHSENDPKKAVDSNFAWGMTAGVAAVGLPGLPEDQNWRYGFIQTVESLEWLATYNGGLTRSNNILRARDVVTVNTPPTIADIPPAPWFDKKEEDKIPGQKGLFMGPVAFDRTHPIAPVLHDTPKVILAVEHPSCKGKKLIKVTSKGKFHIWLIAKEDKTLPEDVVFLRHLSFEFNRTWVLPSGKNPHNMFAWESFGKQEIIAQGSGKGPFDPVFTTPIANLLLANGFQNVPPVNC